MSRKSTAHSSSDACPESFNPGWRLYAALGSLAAVNLAAALDATSISVALPVSFDSTSQKNKTDKSYQGYNK
jgi:hypothetical protein